MNQAELVEIVTKVIAALRAAAPKKRVLVLFCGAGAGFVSGIDAIKSMIADGHEVTVVLSPSAQHILGEDNVRKSGATQVILPDTWANAPALVSGADLVLVPTLSMNTAAHLALGMMDSLLNTLILGALLAGKPVVAVRDSADPLLNGGKVFGAKPGVAMALRNKFSTNLNVLADYGIELVTEPDFWLVVQRYLLGIGPATQTQAELSHAVTLASPVGSLAGAFVTQADLLGFPNGAVVRLAAGSKLTPLARDTAARLKLTLLEK